MTPESGFPVWLSCSLQSLIVHLFSKTFKPIKVCKQQMPHTLSTGVLSTITGIRWIRVSSVFLLALSLHRLKDATFGFFSTQLFSKEKQRWGKLANNICLSGSRFSVFISSKDLMSYILFFSWCDMFSSWCAFPVVAMLMLAIAHAIYFWCFPEVLLSASENKHQKIQ